MQPREQLTATPIVVERVDVARHRFVLCGWVVVVGMVDSNQILRHDSLLYRSSGGTVARPSLYSRTAGPEFDKVSKKFSGRRFAVSARPLESQGRGMGFCFFNPQSKDEDR